MGRIFLLISILWAGVIHAQAIHFKSVLVDTHNDVLTTSVLKGLDISQRLSTGHSDLVRWREGGLDAQFFSVWTDKIPRRPEGFFHDAIEEIDSLDHLVARNPGRMLLARNYRDLKRGLRENKLVCLIGVEGGHMIEDDPKKLQTLYDRGMRYLTLTWNNSTDWASSAMDETLHADTLSHKGLSEFGKKIIKQMNQLGVIIDLSHAGEQTFYDAIRETKKPVLLSHSSVWNICPVFRNLKDEQIRAVAANKGVICINFYSGFISKKYDERSTYLNGPFRKHMRDSLLSLLPDSAAMNKAWDSYYDAEMQKMRPTLEELVDHIDYIVKLVGDDYVGIGSDYDGVSSVPLGLDDVTTYPKITRELMRRGYADRSIKKILGGNVLRVMKENLK